MGVTFFSYVLHLFILLALSTIDYIKKLPTNVVWCQFALYEVFSEKNKKADRSHVDCVTKDSCHMIKALSHIIRNGAHVFSFM